VAASEGASETPARILEVAQNWVHLDQKATASDSRRYRFSKCTTFATGFSDEDDDDDDMMKMTKKMNQTRIPITSLSILITKTYCHVSGEAGYNPNDAQIASSEERTYYFCSDSIASHSDD
jgi:hypothetical protein